MYCNMLYHVKSIYWLYPRMKRIMYNTENYNFTTRPDECIWHEGKCLIIFLKTTGNFCISFSMSCLLNAYSLAESCHQFTLIVCLVISCQVQPVFRFGRGIWNRRARNWHCYGTNTHSRTRSSSKCRSWPSTNWGVSCSKNSRKTVLPPQKDTFLFDERP